MTPEQLSKILGEQLQRLAMTSPAAMEAEVMRSKPMTEIGRVMVSNFEIAAKVLEIKSEYGGDKFKMPALLGIDHEN